MRKAHLLRLYIGTFNRHRWYCLIDFHQPGHIADRQFEIEFLDARVEAFGFTFG